MSTEYTKKLVQVWAVLFSFGGVNVVRYGFTSYNLEILHSAINSLNFGSSDLSNTIAIICVSIVAILHVFFFVMECFFWHIMGPRMMGRMTQKQIEFTKPMAMNQGIYNLGTSFGLFWSLSVSNKTCTIMILLCVIMYAIFGAVTVKKSILVGQGMPALIALVLVTFYMRESGA